MIMSESIVELAKALTKAQAHMKNAAKDSINPHFKSKYADLASVWDAIREPLTSNGLSVVQSLSNEDNKVKCTTMLLHESGQFIKSEFCMAPSQNTIQGVGSTCTYIRRYALASIVGNSPDDDDGNEASGKGNKLKDENDKNDNDKGNDNKKTASDKSTNTTEKGANQKASTQSVPNAAATVANFNPRDAVHVKKISEFLATKNAINLFEVLCRGLENKPFTFENVTKQWDLINPEKPDAPPEGY